MVNAGGARTDWIGFAKPVHDTKKELVAGNNCRNNMFDVFEEIT
jgi:hypothetical protein